MCHSKDFTPAEHLFFRAIQIQKLTRFIEKCFHNIIYIHIASRKTFMAFLHQNSNIYSSYLTWTLLNQICPISVDNRLKVLWQNLAHFKWLFLRREKQKSLLHLCCTLMTLLRTKDCFLICEKKHCEGFIYRVA